MSLNLTSLAKHIKTALINRNKLKHTGGIIEKYICNDWTKYIKISNTYNKEKVMQCGAMELNIISWNSRYKSHMHNHPNIDCIFKVLHGELEEIRVLHNGKVINKTLTIGSISYIDDSIAKHQIINNTDNVAVSLHIYNHN